VRLLLGPGAVAASSSGRIASVSGVDTRKASASHSSAATYRAAGRRVRFGRGGGWPCAYLYGTPLAAAQLGHENSDIASLSAFETPTHGPWYHRSHASQPIMNCAVSYLATTSLGSSSLEIKSPIHTAPDSYRDSPVQKEQAKCAPQPPSGVVSS